MTNKMFSARQGDVYFKALPNKPNMKNMKKNTSPVLAYGEVTGHSHVIMSPALSELDSWVDEQGNILVYSETQDIHIGHDEHGGITLPAGSWYNISTQREFDPFNAEEQERRVRD